MVEINYEDIENLAEEKLIEKVVSTVLEMEQIKKKLDVYITLTNNENIRKINAEHRQIDKATDVLSFPMFDRSEIDSLKVDDEMEDILGDIIVSVEKVREQAEEYGHSFERELAYLVTHGMLHLLGYDHMIDEEKVVMRKREEEILGVLDITRD
ncbi:MAG: rRNA maturation RNase YbeY [Clostridia bacterium]|nr:rRNA maturation RNase YbeY [Clostridia bacterium]